MADDDWDDDLAPKVRPDLTSVMLADSSRDFEPEEVMTFFERLAEGYGPIEIGLSLGWSDAMIKRFTTDPDRRQLIDMIQEAEYESIERAFKLHAKAGNSTAMKLVAFNLMGHRGWQDRRQVNITGQQQHEIVVSVKAAISDRLSEVGKGGAASIGELQAAYLEVDDPADDDIVEAEVVGGDGADPSMDPTDT